MAVLSQESFSQRVLSDMSAAVLVLDQKGYILYMNRPAARVMELEAPPEPGTERFAFASENPYNDDFYGYIFDALYQKTGTHAGRARFEASSGRRYVFRVSSSFLDEPGTEHDQIVITLSDETVEETLRDKVHDSAMTFSIFLFCFSVWIVLYALWEFRGRPFSPDVMTHGIELMALLMLLFILKNTQLTWHDLGLHVQDAGGTVKTALIVAACAVAFLCALKAVIRCFNPTAFGPGAPFFDLSRFGARQILYIFTAGIQEFLARSVIQGNLRRIMAGKRPGADAIVLSSLIFAAMHIHLGFLFMLGAAILAGLEGILYEKQRNLLGVWIVHWTFGVCGTMLWLIDH